MTHSAFLKLAALAAGLSALTTLGVHFIDFPAADFQSRLLLARDPLYIAQKQMIVLHCLLVIVSMFGAALLAGQYNRGLAALGALFFAVFGVTEITRMLSVLVYLNPLREKYLAATDPAVQQWIQLQIEGFNLAAGVMFLLFILAFGLGNLFLGLALVRSCGPDRHMAVLLLYWAGITLLGFGNYFWENPVLGTATEWNGKFGQPLIRLFAGWWLWQRALQAMSG